MKAKYLSLLFIPLMLTSCSKPLALEYDPLTNADYVKEQTFMMDDEGEYYVRKKNTTPLQTSLGEINNLSDLLKNNRSGKARSKMPTTGNQKILVVPISFTDSDESSLEKKKTFIQNAFFGKTSRTNYDSVAGYYNKSSYGQLRITGEVAPWYNAGIASSDWKKKSSSYMNASSILVAEAVDYYKENSNIDFSQYDNDEDGNIDGVYVIYDHALDKNGFSNSIFWAYTYYTYKGENGKNNTEPAVNVYSWTSVNTILQDNNKSYTNYLIHETGHLLGLTDYYNTNYFPDENTSYHYQPTGCFDMMDYNIGDHSSFSKYLLNWTSPMVVKNNVNTKIKLHPFHDSGECLLVPSSSYNNSPFGEYLLIEYFAPSGLNKFSGSYSYTNKDGEKGVYTYPQHHGLKIYHVNAKIGYFEKGNNSAVICTVDNPNAESYIEGKTVGLDYAYNNSPSDAQSKNGQQVLVHLLESSGKNTFIDGVPANNDTLFKFGTDFGITTFNDFKFSNGESPNFTLKVKGISTKDITLEITHQ